MDMKVGRKKRSFSGDNHEDRQSHQGRRELIEDYGKTLGEEAEYLKFRDSQVQNGSPSRILIDDSHSQPKHDKNPIWRGSFNICNGSVDTVDGLVAYVSSKACSKVSDMGRSFPASLCGETFLKLDVWPKRFDKLPPDNFDIGFYFFPESERVEKAYDRLLADLVSNNYALKFVIGNYELLVFSSLELPLESQRIQGKVFLWGLFRRKKVCSSQANGCFPHEQENIRGIKHSASAAAVDAGKETNHTEGIHLPYAISPSNDEERATCIHKIAPASQKLNQIQSYYVRKKTCPINPYTNLTGKAFEKNYASAGSGTSKQVLNQCNSMVKTEKRMEEQWQNGRQESGLFREVKTETTITVRSTEKRATRKDAVVVKKPNYIAEKARDTGTNKGTIKAKSTEIGAATCAIRHEETTKHGKGVLENESHGIEGRASGADSPHNIAINVSSVQHEKYAENAVTLTCSFAAIVPQRPTEAINREVSMVPSSMMHEQTIIDITKQHVVYERQQNPTEADHLGNDNMHAIHHIDNLRFSDERVGISKGHQAVAVQSAASSSSAASAAPDFQAPDVNLPQANHTADVSHELANQDIINHADYSVEHVGPYLVHTSVATILRMIINQHGDIAQDCPLSIWIRSLLLEELCLELQKVLSIAPENLQSHHLESLDSIIANAESAQMNVKWLCNWQAILKRTAALLQLYKKIKGNLVEVNKSPISIRRTLHPESSILKNLKYDIQLLRSTSAALKEEMKDQNGTITNTALKCASKLKRFCDSTMAEGLI